MAHGKKKKWTVMSTLDGNDFFRVEADTLLEAYSNALREAGWALVVEPDRKRKRKSAAGQ